MLLDKDYYNPRTNLKVVIHGEDVITPYGLDWSIPDRFLDGFSPDMITIMGTPAHLRHGEDPVCKLPKREHWQEYADFIQGAVDRYLDSGMVELWNEPDIKSSQHPRLYGCIGDGELYGEFAAFVYQRISGAQVIIGAVADFDYPADQFTADLLDTVGANYGGFSFHCYEYYFNAMTDTCLSKFDYVSDLIEKPVILSETAVQYWVGDLFGFYNSQVEYFSNLQDENVPFYWYTICHNEWRLTDLCQKPFWNVYMME